jgi:hypothetical protein
VPYNSKINFIDWKWIENKKSIKNLKYVKHIRLASPLTIRLDGRSGSALIEKPK